MVAKRLKAFDVEVLAYDPFLSAERANELGVSTVTLSELSTKYPSPVLIP